MAKSTIPSNIVEKYFQSEREIKIKGVISNVKTYSGGNNLLPAQTYSGGRRPTFTYTDGVIIANGFLEGETYDIPTNLTLSPGTYTFSVNTTNIETNDNAPPLSAWFEISLYNASTTTIYRYFYVSLYGQLEVSDTVTLNQTITVDTIRLKSLASSSLIANNVRTTLMLNSGNIALPFEPASGGQPQPILSDFTIGEGSNCQILDFNINEKSDLYCQTFPTSELSIEVENQQGYFSDFTENSIVSGLDSNSYITYYLNIDNTGWYQAWQMQFDSLKATNEKATLKFKPYPMSVFKSLMYDENKYFTKSAWVVDGNTQNDFKTYVSDNYGIIINGISSGSRAVVLNRKTIKNLSNLLFYYGTMLSTITQKPRLLMSLRNNNQIWYNDISWNNYREIDYDFLLEKPILTKETLDEIVINTKEVKSYTSSTIGYTKTISGNFINNTDTIVIYGDGYIFNGITSNDITLTNATLESLNVPNDTYQNYLILEISGTAGEIYQIDINANLYHEEVYETTQEVIRKSNTIKSPNKIEIDNNMISANDYWKLLLEKLDKKIQFKIPALPDLEVGDIIKLNYDSSTNERYIITEIKTSWSNGFIMNIIGYHLDNSIY